MIKFIRYFFIGVCAFVIIVPCLAVLLMLIGGYVHEHGLSYPGAEHKYYTAMKEGNGPEAVRWAKRAYEMAQKSTTRYNDDGPKYNIAYALELNGEYEEALEAYENIQGKYSSVKKCEFQIARVKYKLGRKEEAFQSYCVYADRHLEQNKELLNGQRLNDPALKHTNESQQRIQVLGRIRCGITMEEDSYYMRLSPFLEYKDFLNFMESHRSPLKKYAAAMELFREMDARVVEAHLQGEADYELVTMREQILAERKEKGVQW